MNYDAAFQAIKTIADPLGLSVIQCAEGIVEIACENMADAIRMVSTDRGRDPRDQTYVSYGGAGGLHAYKVAQSAGINHILIPSFVGVDCATGATTMDVRHDIESTFYSPIETTNYDELTEEFNTLEMKCIDMLKNDGIDESDIILERTALMRYVGQSYEVATPVPNGSLNQESLLDITNAFHKEHKKEYGVSSEAFEVALVTLRVTGYSESERTLENKLEVNKNKTNSIKNERDVYFDGDKSPIEVHDINLMHRGQKVTGPAIIEHPNSEIIVPPQSSATIDQFGFIHINLETKVPKPELEVIS